MPSIRGLLGRHQAIACLTAQCGILNRSLFNIYITLSYNLPTFVNTLSLSEPLKEVRTNLCLLPDLLPPPQEEQPIDRQTDIKTLRLKGCVRTTDG